MNRNFGKRVVLANGQVQPAGMTLDSVFRAFQFRMPAGFPGDVNRTHPADIVPYMADTVNPPLYYGQPVVINTANNAVRALLATDTALTAVFGITVRPYPRQQQTSGANPMAAPFGSVTPPPGEISILKSGFIMVPVYGASVLGGAVFAWIAAASGNHVQGLFEIVAAGTNTIALGATSGAVVSTYYNGTPDASAMINSNINVVELAFNV